VVDLKPVWEEYDLALHGQLKSPAVKSA